MHTDTLQLRLHRITYEADGISSFEFRSPSGAALPAFTAGAHIDLHLPNGLVRSYSLLNPQTETHRYVVGVHRAPDSRGGSKALHETLRVGALVSVSKPLNHFVLNEDAAISVFLAGGIGITPILGMLERLAQLGKPWTLHFCARTEANAAYLPRLRQLAEQGRCSLHLNFDDGMVDRMLDVRATVAAAPADAHLYCCGPIPMLESFEAACAARPPEHVHREYFSAKALPAKAGGFVVELARSGKTVEVEAGMSILDAVLAAGVNVPYACMEGTCATCETRVLSGTPDHQDVVLSNAEREANDVMMICCSGSKSERLVLDL